MMVEFRKLKGDRVDKSSQEGCMEEKELDLGIEEGAGIWEDKKQEEGHSSIQVMTERGTGRVCINMRIAEV